jgi:hypothetical protein
MSLGSRIFNQRFMSDFGLPDRRRRLKPDYFEFRTDAVRSPAAVTPSSFDTSFNSVKIVK